jgi:hypothetical protein
MDIPLNILVYSNKVSLFIPTRYPYSLVFLNLSGYPRISKDIQGYPRISSGGKCPDAMQNGPCAAQNLPIPMSQAKYSPAKKSPYLQKPYSLTNNR